EAPFAGDNRREYIDSAGNVQNLSPESNTVISVTLDGNTQGIDADVYNTADIYDDSVGERGLTDKQDDRDLRFIQVATAGP
ncbi:MAG: hypothetical protein IKH71_17880, partial [Oscillospiraceae bacterium]|nr:hypothetical protein [Oscillospiraceae bacterium]